MHSCAHLHLNRAGKGISGGQATREQRQQPQLQRLPGRLRDRRTRSRRRPSS